MWPKVAGKARRDASFPSLFLQCRPGYTGHAGHHRQYWVGKASCLTNTRWHAWLVGRSRQRLLEPIEQCGSAVLFSSQYPAKTSVATRTDDAVAFCKVAVHCIPSPIRALQGCHLSVRMTACLSRLGSARWCTRLGQLHHGPSIAVMRRV